MHYVAIHLYAMAIGFTAAGLVASFVQLVSGEPLRFSIEPSSILASLGGVLLRVLCGPVHPDAQYLGGRQAASTLAGLARPVGSGCGNVESVLRRASDSAWC